MTNLFLAGFIRGTVDAILNIFQGVEICFVGTNTQMRR